jgi:hypothetical protein
MNKEIIEFFKDFEPPCKENSDINIFDIGIHNMYENPFTEILSFFIKTENQHSNKKEFLNLFIYELVNNEDIVNSFIRRSRYGFIPRGLPRLKAAV